jgi:hypothetical protein
MTRSEQVAQLNDAFRRDPAKGRFLVTAAVSDKGPVFIAKAAQIVADFNDFKKGDDPYGERDFFAFDLDGERLFFKIDYYDRNDSSMTTGSEDPADETKTLRVGTLMLASDY